ncbi:MAG: spondin domain-containing protein [Gammaproteobacteria bacterium]|nr:spondin domain-containing protein [Gammaproteobacteria bacterium]
MKTSLHGLVVAMGLVLSTSAMAADISVTVENLSHGNHFTPLLIAAHPAATHLFQTGSAASANLQAMAEGGDIAGLVADMAAGSADVIENPAMGLLAPAASSSGTLMTATANTHLSVVSMILPTNDGFIGLNGIEIPTAAGTYVYYVNGYDAGTEANNELVNGGGAANVLGIPADPGGANGSGGTGVTTIESNMTVHIHRGVLGDFDPAGGVSDLDSSVHRWLNPIAKVTLTVN